MLLKTTRQYFTVHLLKNFRNTNSDKNNFEASVSQNPSHCVWLKVKTERSPLYVVLNSRAWWTQFQVNLPAHLPDPLFKWAPCFSACVERQRGRYKHKMMVHVNNWHCTVNTDSFCFLLLAVQLQCSFLRQSLVAISLKISWRYLSCNIKILQFCKYF